jgi:hypothetical protein
MANRYLDCACADKVHALRSLGWAHVLDLVARGLEEDSAVCEGEHWPHTATELARMAGEVGDLGDRVRTRLHQAEDRDKAEGADHGV